MDTGIIVLVVAILIAICFAGYLIIIFNGLIRLKNNIEKSWANIDVLLKQRTDEIPRLVECVKGYMKHEREVLQRVTEARTAFLNARTMREKAGSSEMIGGALKTLFAVAENYPNLKANENFMQLQKRISGLESEIADRREFFNDSVNNYNIRRESFPDLLIAGIMRYGRRDLFEVSEADRATVNVSF
ncbi:MAG: LemA family protein [Candidatus Tritonobacter lacicola]|nr:LemA family protein [Candidatus Tritonobacter lacicola]